MAFGAYGRDRRPSNSVVPVSFDFYSPLPDASIRRPGRLLILQNDLAWAGQGRS
jgi:hypothetical protein